MLSLALSVQITHFGLEAFALALLFLALHRQQLFLVRQPREFAVELLLLRDLLGGLTPDRSRLVLFDLNLVAEFDDELCVGVTE